MSDRGEENITDQTKVFDALIEKAVKRAVQAQVDKVRETMAELLPEMMKSHHLVPASSEPENSFASR